MPDPVNLEIPFPWVVDSTDYKPLPSDYNRFDDQNILHTQLYKLNDDKVGATALPNTLPNDITSSDLVRDWSDNYICEISNKPA